MKINGISPNKIITSYGDNKKKIDSKDLQNIKGKDSVEISSLGKSLRNYSLDVSTASSNERLEKLREQVEKGTYSVDGRLVAQGILNEIKSRL